MTTREAQCSCSQLKAACSGEPVVTVCHCSECKRRSGSAFGFSATYPEKNVVVVGRASRFIRVGDDGGRIDHRFCPICGTTLCWTIDTMPGVIQVAGGTFEDENFPPPTASVYHESRRNRWVEICAEPLLKRG